jgi:hypothetical protein
MPTNVTTSAETNVITTSQMARVRELDFVLQFTGNILKKFQEALGVTRTIPMAEGTTMYVYKSTGTLQSGEVPEGEIIPLSQIARTKTAIGEITLKKWRKATTAEAIKKSGAQEALRETDAKLLQLVQKDVRGDYFNYITSIDGTTVGAATLQAVLAKSWGQLQVLFEDDAVEACHFINPLTIADYLATAAITVQTAFGMNYIENFLGLGTVIMSSQVPVGHVVSTAKQNLILYYITMNGDIADAFDLTTDETGFIGISTGNPNKERAQIETLVMSGITFLVEYADGVVNGIIDSTPTLGSVSVTSAAGTAVGDTKITLSGYTLGTGEKYVYKTGTTAPAVTYGQSLKGWTEIDSGDDITPTASHTKITVAAVDAGGRAQAAGNANITKKTSCCTA